MDPIYIEATKSTPSIYLSKPGCLEISGRSIPENAYKFYFPLIKYIENHYYDIQQINVKLEYLNTSSAKLLLSIIKDLSNRKNPQSILINWFYEDGDDDVLETGEYYASLTQIPFEYFACEDMSAA